ncbi:hypothetical protein ANMWB30_24400 [Arthrobacter sp. MWB30]|nr:hypothetical protein ANMWB30_24400 [Arthrobacter sp. MWB30]
MAVSDMVGSLGLSGDGFWILCENKTAPVSEETGAVVAR